MVSEGEELFGNAHSNGCRREALLGGGVRGGAYPQLVSIIKTTSIHDTTVEYTQCMTCEQHMNTHTKWTFLLKLYMYMYNVCVLCEADL